MSVNGDRLQAAVDRYLQAAALNVAPPPVSSDPLVNGGTPIEQLLRVLGLAANTDDSEDTTASVEAHGQRETWTTQAAAAFAGQDVGAASQLGEVAGIGTMIAGVAGGLLAPLAQIPQQFAQGAQQAVQAATGLAARNDPGDLTPIEDPMSDSAADSAWDASDFGDSVDPGSPGAFSAGDGAPSGGGTVPAAVLGPAPTPSPATHPSAAPTLLSAQVSPATPGQPAPPGMTGMPMIPPTGLTGTAASEQKGDTKRLAVPAVRNGAPVQGRIAPASGPAVTTRIEGKPVAARRLRAGEDPTEGPDGSGAESR